MICQDTLAFDGILSFAGSYAMIVLPFKIRSCFFGLGLKWVRIEKILCQKSIQWPFGLYVQRCLTQLLELLFAYGLAVRVGGEVLCQDNLFQEL